MRTEVFHQSAAKRVSYDTINHEANINSTSLYRGTEVLITDFQYLPNAIPFKFSALCFPNMTDAANRPNNL